MKDIMIYVCLSSTSIHKTVQKNCTHLALPFLINYIKDSEMIFLPTDRILGMGIELFNCCSYSSFVFYIRDSYIGSGSTSEFLRSVQLYCQFSKMRPLGFHPSLTCMEIFIGFVAMSTRFLDRMHIIRISVEILVVFFYVIKPKLTALCPDFIYTH